MCIRDRSTNLATEINLNLSATDVVRLQENLLVATSINTTWLVYTRALISDAYNNPILTAIDGENATMAADYTADSINPTVVQFTQLSLQTNSFTVLFSEPVLATSYVANRFTIRSQEQGGQSQTLSGGNQTLSPTSSSTLIVFISDFDLTELKRTFGIADNDSTSFIEIADGAVTDTAGNPVVGTTNATGCLLYTSPSPRDATLSRMPSSA